MEKLKNLNVTTVIIMQLFLSQVGNLEKLLCVKSKSCEICSFKIDTEKKQKLTTKIFIVNWWKKLRKLNVTTVIIKWHLFSQTLKIFSVSNLNPAKFVVSRFVLKRNRNSQRKYSWSTHGKIEKSKCDNCDHHATFSQSSRKPGQPSLCQI